MVCGELQGEQPNRPHAEKHQLQQGERKGGVAPAARKLCHKGNERASRHLPRPALSLAPHGGDGAGNVLAPRERSGFAEEPLTCQKQ